MPKPPKDLTFSIAKLELEPGDVLVFKGPLPIKSAYDMLNRLLPAGVRVVFIPPEVELTRLTKAEINGRIEGFEGGPYSNPKEAWPPDLIWRRIAKGLRARAAMLLDWRKLYGTPP